MKRLFRAFDEAGKELYLVGGAVRDLALGVPLEALDDLDFCTNARPRESLAIIKRAGLPTYEMGMEFGTVGAVLQGPKSKGYPKDCQVTTYRSEEYYRRGSRHPVVRFGETIDQDLGRRDFSINSIAMDAEGTFIDPYDGLGDLERGILRVVGDPLETLAEDPLRILRVGRFMAKLGFSVDAALFEACYARADHILDISRERWFQEMSKLMRGPHVVPALRFLHEVRILGVILPEVATLVGHRRGGDGAERVDGEPVELWEHTLQVVEHAPSTTILRWAALLHEIGRPWTRQPGHEPRLQPHPHGRPPLSRYGKHGAMLFEGIARRFTFDNATADAVSFIIRNHARATQFLEGLDDEASKDEGWSDPAVRRFVRQMDPHVEAMLDFARALYAAQPARPGQQEDAEQRGTASITTLTARIAALEQAGDLRPELPSGLGNALIKTFGLRPSPMIGELKSYLEEEIIDGQLESGREASYYVTHLQTHMPDFLREELSGD